MTALQSIAPAPTTKVGTAISGPGNSPSANCKQGVFGSVFGKAVESGNQSREASSDETSDGKNKVNNEEETAANSSARLCAVLRQLALLVGHERQAGSGTSEHKTGVTGKSKNGKTRMDKDVPDDEKKHADETQDNDPSRLVALLEQFVKELMSPQKPESSDGKKDLKINIDEKTLGKIAEKLDELKNLPGLTLGSGSPSGDSAKLQDAGLSGNSLKRLIASLKQIVEQSDVLKKLKKEDDGNANEMVDVKDVAHSLTAKDGEYPEASLSPDNSTKMEVKTAKSDGKNDLSPFKDVEVSRVEAGKAESSAKTDISKAQNAVSGNANAKGAVSGAKAFAWGESPALRTTGSEPSRENRQGKPGQSGNSVNSAGIEAAVKSASSSDNASGESSDMIRNGDDNGKGNLRFADLNIGVHSRGISEQHVAGADGIPDEPAKNISPEQIMTQVKEKLAETPLKGESGLISLKLHPEELGELKLHIRLEDQKLKVEVIAENHAVKDALMQNMNSLRDTLSRHNLTMEKFDVFTAANGGSNQQFREGKQSARNPWVNRYDRFTVPVADESGITAKYLDQGDNSLVDVRF
jgi:flagellar hook-length control protein FliK